MRRVHYWVIFVLISSLILTGCTFQSTDLAQHTVEASPTSVTPPSIPAPSAGVVLGARTASLSAARQKNQLSAPPTENPAKIYNLINAYRRDHQRSILKIDGRLEASARAKLQDMVQSNAWEHQDSSGQASWHLFRAHGYHYTAAGENLAIEFATPWTIFENWRQSPSHNDQLLNPEYQAMGLAQHCESSATNTQRCVTVLHLGAE